MGSVEPYSAYERKRWVDTDVRLKMMRADAVRFNTRVLKDRIC